MLVLVVDDEPKVRAIVRHSLERESFTVVEAGDADEALAAVDEQPVDIAIVDVGLPGTSGLELLGAIHDRHPQMPVILLTGAAAEADRVFGLVSGADDYVVKPFSPRELAARVIAAGRRLAPAPLPTVHLGDLHIDVGARQVTVGTTPIDLTRREFDLLRHLASNAGKAYSRQDLLHLVWASSAEWQGEATVTEHIRRLRSKIEVDPAHPTLIVTVRGSGYLLDPHGADSLAGGARPLAVAGPDRVEMPSVMVRGTEVVHVNPAALELLGARSIDDVVGRPALDLVAPQSQAAAKARQRSVLEGRWPRPEVMVLRRLDGQEIPVEMASIPVVFEGMPVSQVTLWDLGADRARLRELATGVHTDVLDAVIVTDLDYRIRSVNGAAEELYGWPEDEVIGQNAIEVFDWIRDHETEVAVMEVFTATGRWHGEIEQRRRDGSTLRIRTSSTLLRDATGRPLAIVSVNRPIPEGEAGAVGAMPGAAGPASVPSALDLDIRRGLAAGEFLAHYQPVVDLETRGWHGVEALARWAHPERGLLPPAAFIDELERSGGIVDLGLQVLDAACAQWGRWHEEGRDLHVAVNLSARQLAQPGLVEHVEQVMRDAGMTPGALVLEVTETSLVEDLGQATDVLRALADRGAHVSIDDFGTGWASLTYLRRFPVHALKIDRVFVEGLGSGGSDEAIVGSILSLGHELGLEVIAEGIETEAQLTALRDLGCTLGQGYLFARPAAAEELGFGGG